MKNSLLKRLYNNYAIIYVKHSLKPSYIKYYNIIPSYIKHYNMMHGKLANIERMKEEKGVMRVEKYVSTTDIK